MTELDLNPFFFEGGDVGCLLIHGFTGSPPEMRGMGEYLASKGLTVLGVRLAGHGTTPEEMAQTGWRDWVASAEEGLRELKGRCRRVFVGGLSMGGVLTLYLAARHPIAGAIVMAAPTRLGDWRAHFVPIAKHFVRWHRPSEKTDLTDPTAQERMWSYDRMPMVCIDELLRLIRLVRRELPRVTVPVLILQGTHDRYVPLDCAREIYNRVGSQDKELIWLHHSGHAITEDSEREEVWRRAYAFIAARS
ncbi:MAG TPA: alpha/beta fold hydrolase [Anaerolineae bacterium]|nr:alpha/beta fold hydrolase [Anaerolineae bacterium]